MFSDRQRRGEERAEEEREVTNFGHTQKKINYLLWAEYLEKNVCRKIQGSINLGEGLCNPSLLLKYEEPNFPFVASKTLLHFYFSFNFIALTSYFHLETLKAGL